MFPAGGPIPSSRPGIPTTMNYCSVNFMLLGWVLAYFQQVDTWSQYNQAEILPDSIVQGSGVSFANSGPCRRYTHVHGYDKTQKPALDVSDTSCNAGWTAGNVIMSVEAAANWSAALYGTSQAVIPNQFRDMMLPSYVNYPDGDRFYGLATMNFSGYNGYPDPYSLAYGHLGDTYGFTSLIVYFPAVNVSLAIATNSEGAHGQDAPMAILCATYNAIHTVLVEPKEPKLNCTYSHQSYYRGNCHCQPRM